MPKKNKNYKNPILFFVAIISIFLLIVFIVLFVPNFLIKKTVSSDDNLESLLTNQKRVELLTSSNEVLALQQETNVVAIDEEELERQITQVQEAYRLGNYEEVYIYSSIITPKLQQADNQLKSVLAVQQAATASQGNKLSTKPSSLLGTTVPILLYHKLPANFSSELAVLSKKGYTAITMAQLADFFDYSTPIPKKPVVITFDDGFSDQLKSVETLKSYNMKATYYLIVGGERSKWCIGILRQSNKCGDSYLNELEVKQLANSGVAEIGAHTIDHFNLASLNKADQQYEIVNSKNDLEKRLGIKITTFAYPYGGYNQSAIDIVKQAGFRTAVTTKEGVIANKKNLLVLPRVRSALKLP